MPKQLQKALVLAGFLVFGLHAAPADTLQTSKGPLVITFLGHASLLMDWNGKTVAVDVVSREVSLDQLPKADLILITHDHGDHLDAEAVDALEGPETAIVVSEVVREKLGKGTVMKNGDAVTAAGIPVKAVPAYNILSKRPSGEPYHPKGRGNGYVLTLGDKRIYIAGDTEFIPEMADLKAINVAIIPVMTPYTQSVDMAVEAVRTIDPQIVYPYHCERTDLSGFIEALKPDPVDVRLTGAGSRSE